MKKNILFSVFLAFALFCGAQTPCWDGTVATSYDGGDGTPENPYQIATAEQLAFLAQQTNDGTGGDACYILTEDICLNDMDADIPWMPIGLYIAGGNPVSMPFTGVFDGNGHNIEHMYVDGQSHAGGLFGYTDGATIKNLRIANSHITNVNYAGFVVGKAQSTNIINCEAGTNCMISTDVNTSMNYGGIVGYLEVSDNLNDTVFIKDCTNYSGVYADSGIAGGIVGKIMGGNIMIENCTNYGLIIGYFTIGGIVGIADGSFTIKNCDNYGNITSLRVSVGGIIGQGVGQNSVVENCISHEESSVTGPRVGGIAGVFSYGKIRKCVNHSQIVGVFKNDLPVVCAGGIAGESQYISNCYNTGDVTFTYEDSAGEKSTSIYVGGIAGSSSKCHNVYNVGSLSNTQNPGGVFFCCGIMIGLAPNGSTNANLYWLGDYDIPVCGFGTAPINTSTFHSGETPTSWILYEPQYGTTDLLDALNLGSDDECIWLEDVDLTNDGFPIFINNEQQYPLLGDEWYYEITSASGQITYQHLDYLCDTTISHKKIKVIVKTNTLYDKDTEVSREYIYDENDKVYWWNKSQQNFTMLYDFAAEIGDEWQIEVGENNITMHVDEVGTVDYNGQLFRALTVSDTDDIFSGTIVCGVGHLTSFFPEKLLENKGNFDVDGIRCYWDKGTLIYQEGNLDCDSIFEQTHLSVDETIAENGFEVYPNPTNGIIYVLSDNYGEYRITNLMGQTMIIGTFDCENQQIDISSVSEGIYFITIGNATMKIMKYD